MRFPRKMKKLVLGIFVCLALHIFGVFDHPFERNFDTDFHYPFDGDIDVFINKLRNNLTPDVPPINSYTFHYIKNCAKKCENVDSIRLVYLVKSAPENFDKRFAIRSSWGFEKRFSDVEIRTVFLLGSRTSAQLQQAVNEESLKFGDIIQANFIDDYYNNTYKTMSGLNWVVKYCIKSKFYMFVDDDFYVSTKNVLRFLRYPVNYPHYLKKPLKSIGSILKNNRRLSQVLDVDLDDSVRLYSGYVFNSAPHRHYTSKWYVSLNEYPYHKWPPYVTAGSVVLSKEALLDMYYATSYTKHFRFDDIYLGLLAYKAKIEPYHCEEFYFYKKPYNKFNYDYTIASHGYGDPRELLTVWTEQRSLGNA